MNETADTAETAHPAEPSIDEATNTGTIEIVESADHELVEAELLVEEISIDGMCGVY